MAHEMTTPAIRIDFPHVFTPQKKQNKPDDPGQYNMTLMFDKTNQAHMDSINVLIAACDKVLVEGWPDETKRPRVPHYGANNSPIKDGDTWTDNQSIPMKEKYPHYAGHFIIRCGRGASLGAPHVVDMAVNPIMDQGQIYSGCWCHVNINPYQRKVSDNPGISIGLNGVQKFADGEKLGGGGLAAANTMFNSDPNFNPAAQVPGGQPVGQAPTPGQVPTTPTAPPAPGPASPPPVPQTGLTMTEAAGGMTYEQYQAAGWSDQQMIDAGIAVAPTPVAPPAPGPASPPPVPAPNVVPGSVPAGNPPPAPGQPAGVPNSYMV